MIIEGAGALGSQLGYRNHGVDVSRVPDISIKIGPFPLSQSSSDRHPRRPG